MKPSARDWLLLCALHGVASMLLWWSGKGLVDALTWQAMDWRAQPWTLWTTAWVHNNTPHLIANQMALGAMTALAWIVRPPRLCTLAWLLAWPLSTLTLLWWPQIGYAVGLSGVLHAGALVLAVHLLFKRLAVPKALEQHPVVWSSGNEMSVVQAAHLAGSAWGLVLGLATVWLGGGWRLGPRGVGV
jgi:hypothetical protein